VISDVIPAGTTYSPGNFRLDGALLTDAVDGDDGELVSDEIFVRLPAMSDGDTFTVTFNVTIN